MTSSKKQNQKSKNTKRVKDIPKQAKEEERQNKKGQGHSAKTEVKRAKQQKGPMTFS